MKININAPLTTEVKEDYSGIDYCIDVFDEIARHIDDNNIAEFINLFSEWDPIFNNEDFLYDFDSIACYLEDFEDWLERKQGEYMLNFYEKERLIRFMFLNSKLLFSIIDTSKIDTELLVHKGELNYDSFRVIVIRLRVELIFLLKVFFPKGYRLLKKDNYIV